MSTTQTTLTCPACGSSKVAVAAEELFMANGGEFYCHSLKTHDSDTRATCLTCDWEGKRMDLVSVSEEVGALDDNS